MLSNCNIANLMPNDKFRVRPLKAGEKVQENDQWREKPYMVMDHHATKPTLKEQPWQRCAYSVGWTILESDLIHIEFRRPL